MQRGCLAEGYHIEMSRTVDLGKRRADCRAHKAKASLKESLTAYQNGWEGRDTPARGRRAMAQNPAEKVENC